MDALGTPAWISPSSHRGEGRLFCADLDAVMTGEERNDSIFHRHLNSHRVRDLHGHRRGAGSDDRRQPTEQVRFGHNTSSLVGDARPGRGFGLLEDSHQKGELWHDTSSMAGGGATR
jgi:hypothetical protein